YYDTAVIFGGVSSENEVSVITGTMVCNVLLKGGKTVLPVYIDHGGNLYTGEKLCDVTIYKNGGYKDFPSCGFVSGGAVIFNSRGKPKYAVTLGCVINCCHGGAGEGGAVAGLCNIFSIPFASAGLFESAAFMDKYYTKLVLQSLGVKVAKYAYSRHITGAIEGARGLGYPVIVKPATLGSSIGIAKCNDEAELKTALETAFELDGGVLIEEYLSPIKEINCAVYCANGSEITSQCEEVASDGDVLSYDDKYCGGGVRKFPAELEKAVADQIRNTTAKVYSALNMRGIVRFDYIICGGQLYLSEINTVPGSLSQYLLSDSYNSFYGVLCSVIEQAEADFAAHKKRRVISTGILNNINANASIKK
ncbi:MAG: ATP-grasp domain-containing protein, partial [Clostridia bacterium]|nr:ATP-grasp domain-containing protein [Clostridia bacterium]